LRILYFSPRPCWPLTTGARLRDYHLAGQLARGAAVTYLGIADEPVFLPAESNPFERLVTVPKDRSYTFSKLLRGLIGPDPVSVLNYASAGVAAELARLLRDTAYDSVQIEGVHLLSYVPLIRATARRCLIVADWHNIESEIMRRYAETTGSLPRRIFAHRTASLLEAAERRLIESCDVHSLASDREREKLLSRMPRARLETVPNGVDVAYFTAAEQPPDPDPRSDILFVGSMDYHANVDAVQWFVHEVWPLVRNEKTAPYLTSAPSLTIVGRNPAPEVLALAAADIRITGTVDDMRPFYAAARAVIAPLRVGSGTRLKILEAMAAGAPVVSTTMGAEGLNVTHGKDILLADTPHAIAESLRHLYSSPDLCRQLTAAARELVSAQYDWSVPGRKLLRIHTG
jgi:glycosyltransferase involved in cell wall biosynthesis